MVSGHSVNKKSRALIGRSDLGNQSNIRIVDVLKG
jgi:hypothetical protein